MSINCSEKCLYQDDGLCTLNHITTSSGNSCSSCPYFKDKKTAN
ncbi:hypothetical protein CLPU_20c00120 [Gottschalkia purinilytica]|uniref:DUF1540 domain-containing protein n=1 Tax=Gottschalkia purinilytica TaxID=1503 RepID=A0A0L0W6X8_GOTPU|nr:hydroxymyristoyl-ACP dehydratase [Gottschalkia purinilytica]KNF07236.1 hypothetical protein CLPU_20c00120 [Gottschalkia purinilytica]